MLERENKIINPWSVYYTLFYQITLEKRFLEAVVHESFTPAYTQLIIQKTDFRPLRKQYQF